MNQIIGHKHHILFALLMVISALALGQSGSIKGKVSSNGFPMEFVNVGIKGLAIGGITDQNGRFEINNVPFGRQIVLVSMIGFETESKSIALSAENSMITVNFSLTEKAAAIDEVVISGTMKEISKL
ncbi:MAG: carboxypeptidase-like regulatory domain-containing protein, partial [Flavobacteriales bacterium]